MQAILVGVNINDTPGYLQALAETEQLAKAIDIEIVATLTQNLQSVNKQTFINRGKIQELIQLKDDLKVDLIIFDHELSPAQLHNLESFLNCEIFDKTYLILKIFELRAAGSEAKAQVEIAKLRYLKPRLIGSYASMDRQRGGQNRGSGEQQKTIDARNIEKQIASLQKQLDKLAAVRSTQSRLRTHQEIPLVCLVGYTNAGKSSIMNAIIATQDKQDLVYEKDQLFATLATSTRMISTPNAHRFLISDTVGFISDLPHQLIRAFNSTLSQAANADLLLHVVDYHDEQNKLHQDVTNKTLKAIDCSNPQLLIYNKCDLSDIEYPKYLNDQLFISSKDASSINALIEVIETHLFETSVESFFFSYKDSDKLSELLSRCKLISLNHDAKGSLIEAKVDKQTKHYYRSYLVR